MAGYVIKALSPGLYVEHLGHVRVERGIFRMELQYSRKKLEIDVNTVENVTAQFTHLCNETKFLSAAAQCHSLQHHLEELNKEIKWIQNGLENPVSGRQKGGLLGPLLTSVFGVNDEVYQDIENLENNQQDLRRSASHQTKFMISSLASFNETEQRINKRLEQFRIKLNEGLAAVNDMKRWWSAADHNTLNIQILNSYETAKNFVEDTRDYYSKLLTHVNKLIAEAHRKIPPTLSIISDPIIKMSFESDDQNLHVFTHFLLVGISNFTLIKVTPVPLKVQNNSYWIFDVKKEIFAVDYSLQLYFELTAEDLRDSIQLSSNDYVCSLAAIQNMETSPNCIIGEIYQRSDPVQCNVVRHSIFTTIWREMYMKNAWMVIVNRSVKVAITCNGRREEASVNGTSIVKITQDCTIKTKQNINPKRIDASPVLASFHKVVPVQNFTLPYSNPNDPIRMLEPVLKNTEKLSKLMDQESDMQEEIDGKVCKKIHHHSIITSAATAAIVITIVLFSVLGYKCTKYKVQRYRKQRRPEGTTQQHRTEMIELQPIYSSPESRQNV
ncbi:hypothetical protein TcasGA2_TC001822 [Tribolium castaneum]|uniref:Uncharacterized protein n=1 Tax=Tribolium castaneum TaxID=7070 RepID=D7EJ60_TRICA|nr:hypothetical protein TcasGA2_TC001822 [Tribolium castaneum]